MEKKEKEKKGLGAKWLKVIVIELFGRTLK